MLSAAFKRTAYPRECAGEPPSHAACRTNNRAYPREYGGTLAVPLVVLLFLGLSPRVRGKRRPGAETPATPAVNLYPPFPSPPLIDRAAMPHN